MYQINEQQRKESRFAILFQRTIEHGCVRLPIMTKRQAISFRSQLNRFRKAHRGQPLSRGWDLVVNRMVGIDDEHAQITMVYEKDFWDAIDAQIGLSPQEQAAMPELPDPGDRTTDLREITGTDMVPPGTRSIGDVLADLGFDPGNSRKP